MSKIICKALTTFVFLFLSIMFPMLASAAITPSDLVNKAYGNTCAFTNGLDDLADILEKNLCSDESFDNQEIEQCSRVALTQYTLCRYFSVLNNSPTVINTDTFNNKKTHDNEAMNYNPDITPSNDSDNQTSKHKIFNWF